MLTIFFYAVPVLPQQRPTVVTRKVGQVAESVPPAEAVCLNYQSSRNTRLALQGGQNSNRVQNKFKKRHSSSVGNAVRRYCNKEFTPKLIMPMYAETRHLCSKMLLGPMFRLCRSVVALPKIAGCSVFGDASRLSFRDYWYTSCAQVAHNV